ncbi:hypothetical protein PDESU_00821 [Pontiella desulfatans]|uniref:Uncharacterized protein n=1 Tax=Pontiella desulfatans TaxID=2750659 RepID=A0A6C2TX67_PONDE|nr:glycosyltransferase family 4 protein [Pontiella desulfatans]VGO12270.1 hypothetical protein PDESU_00821 [Pontiella desulfatans]
MKILIYDDNPDFGGHQVMACHGIEALAAEPSAEVVCLINPANQKLAERLRGAGIPACPAQEKMPPADLVLCIQGDIAQSTKGIKTAKQAGIECASYIAIPHRMADMGAKLGALRDRLNQHRFNTPDRFITISKSMKQIMLERGCAKPISIVPNGIPAPGIQHQPSEPTTLGVIGRIEFNQKQQDFMVRAFLNESAFKGCHLLLVGGGPDEAKLRTLVAGQRNITLMPWQEDMEAIYEKIDFLMIPSRYEGVPLVMLEALARGIPVIASARDGMKDLLPQNWTFDPGHADALARTLQEVRASWPNQIEPLRQHVLSAHSMEAFKRNFIRKVAGINPE